MAEKYRQSGQTDEEAERARVEVLRRYLSLAQISGLPIEQVLAIDFTTIFAASFRQSLEPDTLPEGKKEYHLETLYGPFSYNSERREGISPLLPEDASTFVLSVTQGKILERLLIQPGITVRKNVLFDFISGKKVGYSL